MVNIGEGAGKKMVAFITSIEEPLAIFHTDGSKKKINEAKDKFLKAYTIGSKKVESPKLFYARITKDKVEEYE